MGRARVALWLAIAASSALVAGRALAQPTTSTSASIVVEPRIVWDGTRDTVIELSNVSNSLVQSLCVYLDGTTGLQLNFEVSLSTQAALRWTVSQGLSCPDGNVQCSVAGGLVPPLPLPFQGSLVCLETDAVGDPVAGNHLAGGATILDLSTGDAAVYEAIGLLGIETNDGDDTLCLGPDAPTASCPLGREYTGCPDQWILSHVAEGAEDPLAGSGSSVSTVLTFFSCAQNFFTASATGANLQLEVFNELEQRFTASVTIDAAWAERSLEDIDPVFGFAILGTTYAHTNISSSQGGFAILAREIRDTGGQTPASASAAFDLAHTGTSTNEQTIVLPPR